MPAATPDAGAVYVADEALGRMREEAVRAFPAEACGLLLGSAVGSVVHVDGFRAARNAAGDHRRFLIEAEEVWRALRAARRRGGDLVGVFHSHPAGRAEPSPVDLAEEWGGLVWLIGACDASGQVCTRAWRRRGEGFEELALRRVGELTA